MNAHIFAYGSLLSAVGHPMGERLRAEATLLGMASVQGQLYRISWYPGVIDSETPSHRVYGEIYRLDNPTASLAWLDAYEGVTRDTTSVTEPDEYERAERPACLAASGANIDCWIYLYQRPIAKLERIASGRWELAK